MSYFLQMWTRKQSSPEKNTHHWATWVALAEKQKLKKYILLRT